MNKKGFIVLEVAIGLVVVGALFTSSFDVYTNDKNKISMIKPSDLTKENGKVIWCKMLNKGEEHCNGLRGQSGEAK